MWERVKGWFSNKDPLWDGVCDDLNVIDSGNFGHILDKVMESDWKQGMYCGDFPRNAYLFWAQSKLWYMDEHGEIDFNWKFDTTLFNKYWCLMDRPYGHLPSWHRKSFR